MSAVAPPRPDGFLAVTDEMWSATWNLNLMAAVRAMRAALPPMVAAGGGSIVNVASLNARLPDPLVVDYSAAKAALVNVAKSVSKEFGGRGIRVNKVDPGPVATDLWLGADGVAARVGAAGGQRPEDVAAAAAAGMVTGRFTRPEEVADLVLFLASRAGGQHHRVRPRHRRRHGDHDLASRSRTGFMPTADFDRIDIGTLRRAGGLKWSVHPEAIGAFVAEMDFGTAPPVTRRPARGRRGRRVRLPAGGAAADGCRRACAAWSRDRYGWAVAPADVRPVADVLPASRSAIEHFSRPGTPVILPTPAYMPFLDVPGRLRAGDHPGAADARDGRHGLRPRRARRGVRAPAATC